MHLPRTLLRPFLHRRHFSAIATALIHTPEPDHILQPLTYLDGFPKPNPKYDETILAIPRKDSGKNISAKERKVGRVPSIVFEQEDGHLGGNKRLISVRSDQIRKLVNHLGRSFFLSRLFHLQVLHQFDSDSNPNDEDIIENVRVLPRSIHLKAGTDAPLNVTFIRAPSDAWLKVDVPIVFRGDDISPGLKKGYIFPLICDIFAVTMH
ncbi:50S ribosomal protein L25, putative [Medicago truncatula]|uniref:50S ribosomal protein L25, putative n=1 Tax=Medicago truncatula TaxID=3880 RepID=A0A072U1G1_MEDTR|nr:50S ribosomal protein L25, putative [Medicago truncatula]